MIESPIYGHASYVVAGDEWIEVITETKEDARTLGAVPKIHAAGKTLSEHRSKLFGQIVAMM